MPQSTKFQAGNQRAPKIAKAAKASHRSWPFRTPTNSAVSLNLVIRSGAQQMHKAAIEAEVEDFLVTHAEIVTLAQLPRRPQWPKKFVDGIQQAAA